MTGTARVQNNRTMMLASVSTDVETRGRRGIAFIGGLPVVGRLFTSPTRDLRTVDIVIAVTPRVLRAPAVTPRDEEMRPSGTLQSPTTGSLEAMIHEADRDDQIAAARVLPRNSNIQLPDAPTQAAATTNAVAQSQPTQSAPVVTPAATQTGNGNSLAATQTSTVATQTSLPQPAKTSSSLEDLPSFVPAPKSLVSDQAATQVAAVNPSTAGTQNAVLSSQPKPTETSLNSTSGSRVARLSFQSGDDTLKIGEKRRLALQLDSELSLSMALMALRFDPKVMKVSAISAGTLLGQSEAPPSLTQSIDPAGVCMVSISALNGKTAMKGSGVLIFVDIEAVGPGVASLIFDPQSLHLVATDARDVVSEVTPGSAIVKQ